MWILISAIVVLLVLVITYRYAEGFDCSGCPSYSRYPVIDNPFLYQNPCMSDYKYVQSLPSMNPSGMNVQTAPDHVPLT